MTYLLRILGYVRPYARLTAGVLATILALAVTGLTPAWLTKLIIDGAIPYMQGRLLVGLVLLYLLLIGANAGLSAVQSYMVQILGQHVIQDLRNAVFSAVQAQSMSFFDKYETGQLMSRVTSDVSLIQLFINSALLNIIGSTFTPLVALVILFRIDVKLTLLVLLAVPPLLVIQLQIARIRRYWRSIQRRTGQLSVVLQESLIAIKLVKAFNRLAAEAMRFNGENWEIRQERLWAQRRSLVLGQLQGLCTSFAGVLVLAVGAEQVMAHAMTIGTLVAFQRYVNMLFQPFQRVASINQTVQMATVAAERVFEVLDAPISVQDPATPTAFPPLRGAISFEHVSFSYPTGKEVLHDLSFCLPAGQTLAIIGPSGAGKSTLVSLIPRFYDPSQGRILVDGHDLRAYRLRDLRTNIAMVLQETFLFNLSVRDNIRYGRPDADDAAVERAARVADAHRFVCEDLADGYDTIIGEKGVRLSGGQRQRLAIARAICADPSILILDEATSSVDTRTDATIQQGLGEVLAGRTTILIAHRLSTVHKAQQILLLHGGRVLAIGSHEQLMRDSPEYRRLHDLQSDQGGVADAAISALFAELDAKEAAEAAVLAGAR
ncbi:MAG TPA: ABC transporter ATP-binding protein [Chloroflexota bacterium]|jgi:ABC-type multidrug transport system fused ATPase/permease subunit|nr:ABC transporter ATP-binding protein [Chloroflexota bacterium]